MSEEPKKKEERAIAWCFTWNHAPEDWITLFPPLVSYLVGGKELADTGTPHIQGYVEFKTRKTLNALKKLWPAVHFEVRKGTSDQAADYCKEDGDFVEMGTMSQPGKRNDLVRVREILKKGGNLRAVVDNATSCQSVRYAEQYLKLREPKRTKAPNVVWLYGAAGVGKTQSAMWHAFRLGYTLDDVYLLSGDSGKWFEGYDAHPVVIIDDIRESFCTFNRILNLLDKYECRVECKGSSRQMRAAHMFITAPYNPITVWHSMEDQYQLTRRFTVVQEILSHEKSIAHQGDAIPTCSPEGKDPETGEALVQEGPGSDQEVRSQDDAEGGDEAALDP